MEACRIVACKNEQGVIDVGAPMKHKQICYEILADAARVIEATSDQHFSRFASCLTIVMGQSGVVDVAAPLPPRALCAVMLIEAKRLIEQFDDAQAPVLRPFSDKLMGV